MASSVTFTQSDFKDLLAQNSGSVSDAFNDFANTSPVVSKRFWKFGLSGFTKTSQATYFNLNGQLCQTGPSLDCPLEAETYFRPICEPYDQSCQRAKEIRLWYKIKASNNTQLYANTGLQSLIRTGAFTVSSGKAENTMRLRFRQDPNTFTQQCIAVYLNRETLLFGSCGGIYNGTPIANAFGKNSPTPHYTLFKGRAGIPIPLRG